MIELVDIKKDYVNKNLVTHALQGISLRVEKGTMLAIMGASGSGKSTLLNIIGGMDRATSGKYLFQGKEITNLKEKEMHAFRKKNISFVFQNFALLDKYTIYENVELPLRARKIGDKKQKVLECLDMMGISELKDKLPTEVSGGQQQRCAIARAIVAGTQLVLADEPTGALDKNTGKAIMEILKGLKESGKTILVVTHDPMVASYSDRIVYIEDGHIIDNNIPNSYSPYKSEENSK
ncbi:MAG: ABC transporter ATP-binding protein [Acetatifactor sp.]